MNAEIISVGTELLLGHTINTDAAFVARELSAIGVNLLFACTVGDNPGRLRDALEEALGRSDVVITTGGLGPTDDDLTKETIASVAGAPLKIHEDSLRRLESYFKGRPAMGENQRKQAMLPEGATVFNKYYTQAEMLQCCVAMNADSFMNWQDGTCNFDSDEFRALLEFVKPFPAEYDWQSDSEEYESDYSRLKNGKQLLYPTSLYSFDDLYYTFAALNNDARFVGFPREDGSTGNAFNSDATLCITTTCRDKAGAWAFIRSTLEEDFQKSLWNFPILRSAFEANAKEAMTQEYETDADGNQILDENGNPIPISTGGMSYGDEPVIELYAVTQEQYDAVMAVIDSTTSFVDYDQNVLNIISDEAAGYLAGSKTVEEASKLIQSRVSLYIQEQK